jgi:hypothetical protein
MELSELSSGDLLQEKVPPTNNPLLRGMAWMFSILFHPLFAGLMMAAWILYLHPNAFVGFNDKQKGMILLTYGYNNVFFPLLIVLLLRAVKFLPSLQMKDARERIIPLVATSIFTFWTYYMFRSRTEIPYLLTDMCQGIFLAVSGALVLNAFFKISLHLVGMGGMMGMLISMLAMEPLTAGLWLAFAILMTGMVATSRLLVGEHEPGDLVIGLLVGMAAQFIAFGF